MKNGDAGYAVGYGKPPRATRFQSGHSGNPKGRPKGSMNLAAALERELKQKVVINENGRRKTITKLEAATKQIVNKSASGDLRAQALLYNLLRSADESNENTRPPQNAMSEGDQKLLQGMLQRLNQSDEEVLRESQQS